MTMLSEIKLIIMNAKKIEQKRRLLNSIVIDAQNFVTTKALAEKHKMSQWTIQKHLNAVEEKYTVDACKIGHNLFYNEKEADIIITEFKHDVSVIVDNCIEKLTQIAKK